ncbi:MAG: hypothetical protein V3U75_06115 [Methylococcaceae bacterium]
MNARTASLLFGIVFIAVVMLGFTPNILVSPNGIFTANTDHSLVQVITAIVFLVGVFNIEVMKTGY